jgi:exonuclease SbcC
MILTRLKLENFRSFRSADLSFAPGQNYIFGQNWQGKSSIVDAIGFALFGADVFPKKLAGAQVKPTDFIYEHAQRGRVELSFRINDADYTLTRVLPPGQVLLQKNGKKLASKKVNVSEALRSIAGMDAKLFQSIFYADQDELRRSLDFSPEDRRVFVERLLGVEEWRERQELFRNVARQLERLLEELISGKLGAFLEDIEQLESDIAGAKEELKENERELRDLQKQVPSDIRGIRKAESAAEGTLAKEQNARTRLKVQLDGLLAQQKGLKKGRCGTCTQVVPNDLLRTRLSFFQTEIREIEKRLKVLERSVDKLESDLYDEGFDDAYDVAEDIPAIREHIAGLTRQLAKDSARQKKLRGQLKIFGKKTQQVDRTKAEIAFIRQLQESIQDYRRTLRSRLVKQLQVGVNDFLARFHDGDNDFTIILDGDLNIQVSLHGRTVPVFNLSGAAKDILALGLRYGLLRIAGGGVNVIVLDEPTRHMDASNCYRLKGIFNELSDRQLIVVTVHQEFSDALGKQFVVIKDPEHCSIISVGGHSPIRATTIAVSR